MTKGGGKGKTTRKDIREDWFVLGDVEGRRVERCGRWWCIR